jgi:hypothetical protein
MGTVERAFELARTGEVDSLQALERRLSAEGWEQVFQHLSGGALKRQLAALIHAARDSEVA